MLLPNYIEKCINKRIVVTDDKIGVNDYVIIDDLVQFGGTSDSCPRNDASVRIVFGI